MSNQWDCPFTQAEIDLLDAIFRAPSMRKHAVKGWYSGVTAKDFCEAVDWLDEHPEELRRK